MMKNKVIEIEDYYGNTLMSFIVDEKGNITNENNCSVADITDDYIYNSDRELIRVQSDDMNLTQNEETERYSREEIKDLIYDTQNEFSNELDYDYESESGKELTDSDFEIMEEYLNRFCNKLYTYIDEKEHLGTDETLREKVANQMYDMYGEEYESLTDTQKDKIIEKVLNDNEFNDKLQKLIVENIDYYLGRV